MRELEIDLWTKMTVFLMSQRIRKVFGAYKKNTKLNSARLCKSRPVEHNSAARQKGDQNNVET